MSLVEYYLRRAIADLILAEARVNQAAEQMASISREFSEGVELMFHAFSSLASALDAGICIELGQDPEHCDCPCRVGILPLS